MICPVAAIILTKPDRKHYLARALACLKQQTYTDSPIYPILQPSRSGVSIGALRNEANERAYQLGAGVAIHWDDDDWSAPDRIASQLRDLQDEPFFRTVGYNRMLFWDSVKGEAWRFTSENHHWVLGTSLCYWVSAWRHSPFADLHTGEDLEWFRRVRPCARHYMDFLLDDKPPLIAELHGGNTTSHVDPQAVEWKREEWLEPFCRDRMKL